MYINIIIIIKKNYIRFSSHRIIGNGFFIIKYDITKLKSLNINNNDKKLYDVIFGN